MVQTETRGAVPITVTQMESTEREVKIAAFLYRGPSQFYGTTKELKLGMFLQQLKGDSNTDGAFYRFIPTHDDADIDELKVFIGEYLDAANKASDGYF